ncbi:GNAT family N-acetyltransferase [Tenacibaculum jejuense]|uniref:Siderophore biosynthesis protein, IucA/IucC family n=1 Tax=Tenacibaculum jejuense TaxID=584609 RepID=A0A238U5S2_9FLAO|nr:GNAT family N-acetyltransferase [Tenacibaculum jejuense]SNR14487.1 Siderophore biosynthesis protein, IucA/IucC family [Tenacibaculum jejuense]
MISTNTVIFSKDIPNVGKISIRPIHLDEDINFLHEWLTMPYAKYWGMLEYTLDQVKQSYLEIEDNENHHAFIGLLNDVPVFLIERYKASEDVIAAHYDALLGDYGMHILVAPAEKRIPQFTWYVFSTVMEYFFSLSFVERVVVEPDKNNEKIHVLNKKAGFVYDKDIQLSDKIASLAFCTRESFQEAINKI